MDSLPETSDAPEFEGMDGGITGDLARPHDNAQRLKFKDFPPGASVTGLLTDDNRPSGRPPSHIESNIKWVENDIAHVQGDAINAMPAAAAA